MLQNSVFNSSENCGFTGSADTRIWCSDNLNGAVLTNSWDRHIRGRMVPRIVPPFMDS